MIYIKNPRTKGYLQLSKNEKRLDQLLKKNELIDILIGAEEAKILREIIEDLGHDTTKQAIVKMRYIDKMKIREIAEIFGCTNANVYMHLNMAIKHIYLNYEAMKTERGLDKKENTKKAI